MDFHMDDMLKLYVEKRSQYEEKIQGDLLKIEEAVSGITKVGDYFSVGYDEMIITIKAIEIDGEKHLGVYTDKNPTLVPFCELTLLEHPDLILWIIQNTKLIEDAFREVLINVVRNGENIINTLRQLNINYE